MVKNVVRVSQSRSVFVFCFFAKQRRRNLQSIEFNSIGKKHYHHQSIEFNSIRFQFDSYVGMNPSKNNHPRRRRKIQCQTNKQTNKPLPQQLTPTPTLSFFSFFLLGNTMFPAPGGDSLTHFFLLLPIIYLFDLFCFLFFFFVL